MTVEEALEALFRMITQILILPPMTYMKVTFIFL